jgi:hypothetical protein
LGSGRASPQYLLAGARLVAALALMALGCAGTPPQTGAACVEPRCSPVDPRPRQQATSPAAQQERGDAEHDTLTEIRTQRPTP